MPTYLFKMKRKKTKDTKFEWLVKQQLNKKFKVVEYRGLPQGGVKKRTIHKDLPKSVADTVVMMKERKNKYNIYELLQNSGIL